VDDFGVARARGEEEGGLVQIVERGGVGFVAEFDEELADGEVAERGGEVQVGVGVAGQREVGVVEEVWVRLEDAPREKRVVGVDGAPEADGGVDPGLIVSGGQLNHEN
jgi:hypothetical protein